MQRFVESTKRRGFTLMELLVVLAILVLLMAMVAPRVLKFLGKSDISVTKSQIGSLKKSLDLYSADCRKFPSTEQGLNALIAPPAMGESGTAQRGWDGPYLDGDSVPLDPWGLPYGYAFPRQRSRGPGPEIWSFGPDNMDGTEDDIVSWTVAASTGEGMPGEEGMMGGELGPDGMPLMDQGGLPPMDQGGLPPMDQGGLPPMDQGGLPPMNQGGLPPMDQGGLPPMGGGTPPMGGGLPPAGGTGQMGGGLPPAAPGGALPPPQQNF
jgi:general secretion pathway protein G